MFAGKSQMDRGRAKRRALPIMVYVGHNGDGKTLHAVWDTLPSLEDGRPCLSTVRLLDYRDPRPCEGWETVVTDWHQNDDHSATPVYEQGECSDLNHGAPEHRQAHPLYVRFTAWTQLLSWRFGSVLMDEVTGVADASDWAAVPQQVVNKFPQLRRDECSLRITTLSYSNCNKRIRQAALGVVRCKGTMPASPRSEFGKGRVFRPNRMSSAVLYDAKTLPMDDPSLGAYDKARVLNRSRLWVPDCAARLAYDTYAPVDTVGTVTDAGNCAYCGGTRRRAECSCADYTSSRAVRRPASARSARRAEDGAGAGRAGRHAAGHDHLDDAGAAA